MFAQVQTLLAAIFIAFFLLFTDAHAAGTVTAAPVTTPSTNVLSYKEWKSEKVQEALGKVVKLKTQLEVKKRKAEESVAKMIFHSVLTAEGTSPALETNPLLDEDSALNQETAAADSVNSSRAPSVEETQISVEEMPLEKLEMELSQAQFNLDTVKDLSVNDYFSLYLLNQEDKKTAFTVVAAKLTPDEMAELMLAYDKTLNNAKHN
jgi:hypothetical protein